MRRVFPDRGQSDLLLFDRGKEQSQREQIDLSNQMKSVEHSHTALAISETRTRPRQMSRRLRYDTARAEVPGTGLTWPSSLPSVPDHTIVVTNPMFIYMNMTVFVRSKRRGSTRDTATGIAPQPPNPPRRKPKNVGPAVVVGTALELFDFYLYASMAALGVRPALLSLGELHGQHSRRVLHVRGRIPRPPARRNRVRHPRRQNRAQGRAVVRPLY